MKIGFTRVSSRGQIVIPKEFRETFKQGDKLFLVQEGEKMIARKAQELTPQEDKEYLAGVNEGLKDLQEGRSTKMSKEEFLRELHLWMSK